MSKKIKLFVLLVLPLTACQMNAGQDFFPTNLDCRCGREEENNKKSSSFLAVNVFSVIVPSGTPAPSASPTATPSSIITPTPNPTASPSPSTDE